MAGAGPVVLATFATQKWDKIWFFGKESLFLDDFVGDVEGVHIFTKHETSLGIEARQAVVEHRSDWEKNVLEQHK